jgi:itaconyl-CoA hydratase
LETQARDTSGDRAIAASGASPSQTAVGEGFFEDFAPGDRMKHARSATITDIENNQLSKQMMNTAQVHWNEHALPDGRVVFGLVTAAMVLGLASQDTASKAIAEVMYDQFRFVAPVHQGTTLCAYSEVIDMSAHGTRSDAGLVTFQHYGVDHDDRLVFTGRRTLLLERRYVGSRA